MRREAHGETSSFPKRCAATIRTKSKSAGVQRFDRIRVDLRKEPCLAHHRPPSSKHDDRLAAGSLDLESTLALLERARGGDHAALDRLFLRHLRPLQRWASGRLPSWARGLADTDDLVQDTLLHTLKRVGEFEPRPAGAFQAYLRKAVMNRLRDELRRRGRQPASSTLDEIEFEAAESPLEDAIGQEAVERYQRALQRLKPEERRAILARVETDCSYEQLAHVLGKPTAEAARKAAQRALVRLAEEMKRAIE